jgi:hypothetical protein
MRGTTTRLLAYYTPQWKRPNGKVPCIADLLHLLLAEQSGWYGLFLGVYLRRRGGFGGSWIRTEKGQGLWLLWALVAL